MDINHRELKLIGDELNIRYYYGLFFYYVNKFNNSTFIPDDLRKRILKIIKTHKVVMDIRWIECIIFVCINRFSYKNNIRKIDNLIYQANNDWNEMNDIKCFNAIIMTIEKYYKIKLPKNEHFTLRIYLFLASVNTYEQGEQIIECLKVSNPEFYQMYLDYTNTLIINNNIKNDAKNSLIITLSPAYFKFFLHSHLKLSTNSYFKQMDILPNELLPKYEKNLDKLHIWNERSTVNNLFKNELECLAAHATITMEPFINKINILFLFSGIPAKETIIYLQLKNHLRDFVTIDRKFNNKPSYNFIITNFQQDNTNIPTIYISENLTASELEKIKNYINTSH